MSDKTDTICALSTAPGRAGIAMVRLSGPESFELLGKVFVPERRGREPAPRYAQLGLIADSETGAELDEVIVTRFPSPNSYTGEDVVEISLHGSPVLVAALLDCLCARGARIAEPGEFTMRAFLNGRMDLTQAEAVRDVIEARTLYQAQVASRQRAGEVSQQLRPIKQALIDIIVRLESAVEFVEEITEIETRDQLASKLVKICRELENWISSFRRGRIVRDGFDMAIVGRPNVGKSSLFNALLAQDRSIVTEFPGTTRDLVSEFTSLDGIPVRLVDTAGIRVAEEGVEQLGVDRSFRAMADADAILLVVDTSLPPSAEDEGLRQRLMNMSCIVVMNKCDMSDVWSAEQKAAYAGDWPSVIVSAKTGTRIDKLRKTILSHLFGDSPGQRDGILITHLRQCRCLEATQKSLGRAATALGKGLSEEFVLVDLREGLDKLGDITGETAVEDLLNEIFSRFCIGK